MKNKKNFTESLYANQKNYIARNTMLKLDVVFLYQLSPANKHPFFLLQNTVLQLQLHLPSFMWQTSASTDMQTYFVTSIEAVFATSQVALHYKGGWGCGETEQDHWLFE